MNAAHVPAVTRTNTIALVVALVVATATILAAIALLSSDGTNEAPDTVIAPAGEPAAPGYTGDWKDFYLQDGARTGGGSAPGRAKR